MYKYILFDADNTLLDFDADEHNAFFSLMKEHNIKNGEQIHDEYIKYNLSLWERFERGEIDKDYILLHRFSDLIDKGLLTGDGEALNSGFCEYLSEGGIKMPDAEEICRELTKSGYELYIVTNGIKFIQDKRFASSGLMPYFKECFISEVVGCQKPMREFFDVVLDKIGDHDRSKYLIVGDSLTSDIKGGINSDIDTCWFNPKKVRNDTDIVSDYTIYSLIELRDILLA